MAEEAERFARQATQMVEQRARDAEDFTQRATAHVMELSKGSQSDTEESEADLIRRLGSERGGGMADVKRLGTSADMLTTSVLPDEILEKVRRAPGGRVLRPALEVATSPSTFLTAGVGPGIGAGLRTLGPAGRLAAGFAQPVLQGGLASRLAGETAVGTGALIASQETARALPEDTPGALRVAATLGAGLAGGAGAVGGLQGARRAGVALDESVGTRLGIGRQSINPEVPVLYRGAPSGEDLLGLSKTDLPATYLTPNPDVAAHFGETTSWRLRSDVKLIDQASDEYSILIGDDKLNNQALIDELKRRGYGGIVRQPFKPWEIPNTIGLDTPYALEKLSPEYVIFDAKKNLIPAKGILQEGIENARLQPEAGSVNLPNIGGKPTAEADALNAAIRGGEQVEDPAAKLTTFLRDQAKPARAETEKLYSEELAKRAGALGGIQSRGLGRKGYYQQLSVMKGPLPKAAFDPPEAILSTADIDGLHNRIDGVAHLRPLEKLNTHEALDKTLLGQLPTDGEIANLEAVFGTPFAEQLLKFRGNPKGYEQVMDAAGLPRAFMSALDASAPLRQGFVATVSHPTESIPAMRQMFKALLSEKNAAAIDESILNSPRILMKKEAGLYLAPRGAAAKVAQREETFATRFARKIPGIQMSERGFVTYLNKLRSDVFDMYVDKWERVGYQYTDEDLKKVASFVNHATGRGDVSALGNLAPFLNATMFSPRLLASRVQTVTDLVTSTPAVRKEVARDLAVTLGVGVTTLGLLSAAGAVVGLDPRSTDFGKARFGKQRIDIWGSYQPLVRYSAQILTGQAKTQTGDVFDISRKETALRFGRSKMSPTAGLVTDLLTGKNVRGNEVTLGKGSLKDIAANNFTPLFAQDLYDAFTKEGFTGALRALPAGLGASVQTYEPSTSYKLQQALQEKYPDRERNREVDNVLINDDPELRAMRTKGYEEAAAQGQDYAKESIETDKWKAAKEQELHLTDSARGVLAKDPGSGKAFTDAYSTFQDQVVGQISREMFGTEDKAKKTPAGQALLALRSVQLTNYYDPETYSYDYDAYDRDRTEALAALKAADPLVADAVERRMSTVSPEVRVVEAQFKQARELKNQFYEKPKYKGLTLQEGQEVDLLRQAVEMERQQNPNMDEMRALRRVRKDYSPKAVSYYRRHFVSVEVVGAGDGGITPARSPQDPARDKFLMEHPEILRFYPKLADNLSDKQKFKLPHDIILSLVNPQVLARTG